VTPPPPWDMGCLRGLGIFDVSACLTSANHHTIRIMQQRIQ